MTVCLGNRVKVRVEKKDHKGIGLFLLEILGQIWKEVLLIWGLVCLFSEDTFIIFQQSSKIYFHKYVFLLIFRLVIPCLLLSTNSLKVNFNLFNHKYLILHFLKILFFMVWVNFVLIKGVLFNLLPITIIYILFKKRMTVSHCYVHVHVTNTETVMNKCGFSTINALHLIAQFKMGTSRNYPPQTETFLR